LLDAKQLTFKLINHLQNKANALFLSSVLSLLGFANKKHGANLQHLLQLSFGASFFLAQQLRRRDTREYDRRQFSITTSEPSSLWIRRQLPRHLLMESPILKLDTFPSNLSAINACLIG